MDYDALVDRVSYLKRQITGILLDPNADRDENGKIDENFAMLKDKTASCHITNLEDREYPWRRLFTLLNEIGYGDRFTLLEGRGTTDPDRFLPYYRALWLELTGDPAP
jgi:hypothetical protein